MTLISADNDFALMAVLFTIAGAAFLAERTRIGSHLTGAVIAILAAIARLRDCAIAAANGQPAHHSALGAGLRFRVVLLFIGYYLAFTR